MKKALIAYFSQGGTTKTIAKKIAAGLSESDILADLHDITSPLPDLKGYDLLGVGSPVYVFRPPFNVMEFIEQLPPLNGLPFFVFLMYGKVTGTAGNILRNALYQKGGREIGYSKYKGANRFLGYLKRGVLFSPDNPTNDERRKAENFAKDLADKLKNNKTYTPPAMDLPPGIVYKIEDLLIEYGNRYSQVRSHGMGYIFKAGGYFNTGDLDQAVALAEKAVSIAGDPFYELGFKTILAISYLQNDEIDKARRVSEEAIAFSNQFGCEVFGDLQQIFLAPALIDEGQMTRGYNMLKKYEYLFKAQQRKSALLSTRLILGKLFSQIALKKKSVPLLVMLKNIGFILRHVPTAEKTAINYFTKAIKLADEIKAVGMAAQAYLELGLLHKEKKRPQEARTHLKTAISKFESIDSDVYMKQAKKELYSL